MCFLCDGGTADELMREITDHIDQHGWHVMGVDGGPRGSGWAYTIGLTESFGHPELAYTGMCCFRCAHHSLNAFGARIAEGEQFATGDDIVFDGDLLARFGPVHQRHWQAERFNMWLEFYDGKPWRPSPCALQVIWFDRRGRWQDDRRNRRWPLDRLDRAPHINASGRTLLR